MNESEEWVYRAVAPQFIDPSSGEIEWTVFRLRPDEEELSVYSAHVCSPRDVLQILIDRVLAILNSKSGAERAKFAEWVERKGASVERRMELGWRVIRLPVSAFLDRGFEVGEADAEGHIGIRGSAEDFEEYGDALVEIAEIVTVD